VALDAVGLEAFTRLLLERRIFTKEEFLQMVKVVDQETNRKRIF
jgi:hypothetical protein